MVLDSCRITGMDMVLTLQHLGPDEHITGPVFAYLNEFMNTNAIRYVPAVDCHFHLDEKLLVRGACKGELFDSVVRP